MRRSIILLIMAGAIIGSTISPALADWQPADGHKMHFPQLPNEEGWDVMATFPESLAEDWQCIESGYIKDFHFWGSWKGGVEGEIQSFIISIHADIPAAASPTGYSMPGATLWEYEISDFSMVPITTAAPEGWYDPTTIEILYPDHNEYFQYNVFLDSSRYFRQDQGTIYWMNISAVVADPVTTQWGWKSSIDHWNDDGVYFGGSSCIAPDNGSGTIDYPADCDFISPLEKMMIIDGLPPGTTIESDPIFNSFVCGGNPQCSQGLPSGVCEGPGGTLGGSVSCFDGYLELDMVGTGSLTGFNRHLVVPMFAEIHHGPRTPGNSVQTFPGDFYRWSGELFGDPDFCTFRVTAGTDYGLPSPGQTVLTELPSGDYAVESFFDVTYQIEFEGCPGSMLDGYMGTTTAAIRLVQGGADSWMELYEPPDFVQSMDLSFVVNGGVIECDVAPDSTRCLVVDCPNPFNNCQPVCVKFYPPTGDVTVLACECLPEDACHVDISAGVSLGCVVPDNGSGTADLPPVECTYKDPFGDWLIIDGLPPSTTIEMDGILMDFLNIVSGPGGSLGGEYEHFDATLDLTVHGTGDLTGFSRHLAIPVECETHSAPRNPGDPVQSFAVVLYSMTGELFGDPDFCTFRITAGTSHGLPGPGQTVLTELPSGDFAVESFFDVTYQIEFEGCPASPLDGYVGTTTSTVRIQTMALPPTCTGDCPAGYECTELATENPDGTIEICCECVLKECAPNTDSSACNVGTCLAPSEECQPTCIRMNNGTGDITVLDCTCQDSTSCHVDLATGGGNPCEAADNGSGTVDLPPVGCTYEDPVGDWMIVDGLPPSATIEMDGVLMDFINITSGSGGSLGGEYEQFEATLELTVHGTGDLTGFNRHLAIPIECETHSAPRNPGDPVQSFNTVIYEMTGELFGDPDFCTFRIRAGNNLGLPSPGHTVLTELPSGDYAVESFFDVTYRIEFEGCPGSQLEDYMGTTTATIRIQMGSEPPLCAGDCPPGEACERIITDNGDGTIDICCQCVPLVCEPNGDSSGCNTNTCLAPEHECMPVCTEFDLSTGQTIVVDCACQDSTECYVDVPDQATEICTVPDNGGGTANLPPVGCEYESPDERWMIIDGLPPGTTIEMEGLLNDFINITSGSGGSLGGEIQQFDATLELTVAGTGDLAGFNRHLAVPITCETHSAPRTPGDSIQTFETDMYSMTGELFGDPDFCTFRIAAGTYYSLPGPGETEFTELPDGTFAVESFFDITYQIEFEGCPGSPLDGYSGTTTATIQIQIGLDKPGCAGTCPEGQVCQRTETYNPDGTLGICCTCVNEVCDCSPGNANGDGDVNVGDAVYIISYVFKGGQPPTPYPICSGDANCDCQCNVGDAVYLISYVFKGGQAPCTCEEWLIRCGSPLRK